MPSPPDDGPDLLHHFADVGLTNLCAVAGYAVFGSNIAQGPAARKIVDHRPAMVFQIKISAGHKRVLLSEERAIFTEEGETVNIRINDQGKIAVTRFERRDSG